MKTLKTRALLTAAIEDKALSLAMLMLHIESKTSVKRRLAIEIIETYLTRERMPK